MLDLLIFVALTFFIYMAAAVLVITIGILIIILLKDAQHKAEEDERSDI